MADNETTADIIAWLRKPREGENAYLTLWRDEIADRLEAAHKRELSKNVSKNGADFVQLGDAAKLREALKLCLRGMCGYCRMDAEARGMTTECVNGCEVMLDAKSALAAPPRNCDMPKVMEDPWRAWLDDKSNWDEFGSPKLEIHDWLLAPATEKEGGNDGK